MINKLQQLIVIKIERDTFFQVCGYYDNINDAEEYIKQVHNAVNIKMMKQFAGEYIIVPCFYINIPR